VRPISCPWRRAGSGLPKILLGSKIGRRRLERADTSPFSLPATKSLPRSLSRTSVEMLLGGTPLGGPGKGGPSSLVNMLNGDSSCAVAVRPADKSSPEESSVPYGMEGCIRARNTRKKQPRFVCLDLISLITCELASTPTCVHDSEKHRLKNRKEA
jgi:hypothetical protein